MSRFIRSTAAILVCAVGATLSISLVRAHEPEPADRPPATQPATQPVKIKELSANVKKGLDWLAATQLESGAWGQGEEATGMRDRGGNSNTPRDAGNVADTCAAALALMRAGSTPADGAHAQHIARAVHFVCDSVERSDADSMHVTDVNGTRLQGKLGPNIDTFIAALVLAEVQNRMPDEAGNQRVANALQKVLAKIGKNQKDDGSFVEGGWVPVLAQGVFSKAINRAAQNGAKVDEKVRERAEQYARAQYDEKNKQFAMPGAAGIALYSASANLGAMKDSNDTNAKLATQYRQVLESPTTSPADRAAAEEQLKRFDDNDKEQKDATRAVVDRLGDQQFVNGFGSNGGEEFLSYMNIGETLVAQGGEAWEKWDKSITENLSRIQNDDGSWSGQHCITGRTFCTSAALMTLTVDRATTPIAREIRK